jgi:hypothetical protein
MGVMKYFLEVVIYGLAEGTPLEEIKQEMMVTARNHNVVVNSESIEGYFTDILLEINEEPQVLGPYLDDDAQQHDVHGKVKAILSQLGLLKPPQNPEHEDNNHSGLLFCSASNANKFRQNLKRRHCRQCTRCFLVDTNRALTRPTQAARTIITSNCMTTPTH